MRFEGKYAPVVTPYINTCNLWEPEPFEPVVNAVLRWGGEFRAGQELV